MLFGSTFLMLPAMFLVENPYQGNGNAVSEAMVKLGSQGRKDYIAGILLLFMVIKKTLNICE